MALESDECVANGLPKLYMLDLYKSLTIRMDIFKVDGLSRKKGPYLL